MYFLCLSMRVVTYVNSLTDLSYLRSVFADLGDSVGHEWLEL